MIEQSATVIAHSISPEGIPLITLHLREWRPIHSELMTHKMLGKSAGSSRARPSKAIIEQVRNEPMMPIEWGKNEPGMKATELMDVDDAQMMQTHWHMAAIASADQAEFMMTHGAHKQIVNRLLEPFTYIDVLVTGTEWNNFFHLRDHEDADPSMRDLAVKAKKAIAESVSTQLKPGEWHLPYITPDDWVWAKNFCKHDRITRDEPTYQEMVSLLRKISAARCARVSYKLFDGTTDHMKDLQLFEDLIISEPVHASPSEHQGTPMTYPLIKGTLFNPDHWEEGVTHIDRSGQLWSAFFKGWVQHRKLIPNEHVPG